MIPDATPPILAFANLRQGTGKTTLSYLTSWQLAAEGETVLVCDLDPVCDLTRQFLTDEQVENIWKGSGASGFEGNTLWQLIKPAMHGLASGYEPAPVPVEMDENLWFMPGDMELAGLELPLGLALSQADSKTGGLPAVWERALNIKQAVLAAAEKVKATVVIVDTASDLSALTRLAWLLSDYAVIATTLDSMSLQGLQITGETFKAMRDWDIPDTGFSVPETLGYLVFSHSSPTWEYDKREQHTQELRQIYPKLFQGETEPSVEGGRADADPNCLGIIPSYHNLSERGKRVWHDAYGIINMPLFKLVHGQGVRGSMMVAREQARKDYAQLADKLLTRIADARSLSYSL